MKKREREKFTLEFELPESISIKSGGGSDDLVRWIISVVLSARHQGIACSVIVDGEPIDVVLEWRNKQKSVH